MVLFKVIPCLFIFGIASACTLENQQQFSKKGYYVSGDFHTHTNLSDGNMPETTVVKNAFKKFNLYWMANSEHGGAFNRNVDGVFWEQMQPVPYFKGDKTSSGGHRNMWRWQSLTEFSFPMINELRDQYPHNKLIQGVEWNCPSHEHASVGFINIEPKAVGDFEYLFDQGDNDQSRNSEFGIYSKSNTTHARAVEGIQWLQNNYTNTSYILLNHPSRKLKYTISDIRDFMNAGPDVFIGLEGMPGHQKESYRGGYSSSFAYDTYKARTYGGADYMLAKIGGLWDALLSDGRRCWMFGNSDFHDTINDFYPGEYQKNWTFVEDSNADQVINNTELLAGFRSGNSYVVSGDLISDLSFQIQSFGNGQKAVMGQTLKIKPNDRVKITVAFKCDDIKKNRCRRNVDHIDLIGGTIHTPALPGTIDYSIDTVSGVSIVKVFRNDFQYDSRSGYFTGTYTFSPKNDCYFRLRGTNLMQNTPNQTDEQGNPLNDDLEGVGANNADKAWNDLWFYSNPIFIDVVDAK